MAIAPLASPASAAPPGLRRAILREEMPGVLGPGSLLIRRPFGSSIRIDICKYIKNLYLCNFDHDGQDATFRFYFHLLIFLAFLHFEVVLSGKKWAEVDQSGRTPVQDSLLGNWLKGDIGAATSRKLTGHGG